LENATKPETKELPDACPIALKFSSFYGEGRIHRRPATADGANFGDECMTLILTVANARGVYQSSDYQLVDQKTLAPVSDRAGSKQLSAMFEKLNLELAFTGVASVGVGSEMQRTIDHLSATLKALPHESNLKVIIQALVNTSNAWCGSRGPLTLVLSVACVGKPFQVVVISNTDWRRAPPSVKRHFDVQVRTVQKPFHLISGFRGCVPDRERARLKAITRKIDATQQEVVTALTHINSTAAENSNGFVSKECWVTAQFSDGEELRSGALNFGSQGGFISSIIGDIDMAEWMKTNLTPIPGEEIRIVQNTGTQIGPRGGALIAAPKVEPKNFSISGLPVRGLLRSPSGKHCASIEIIPLSSIVTAKGNKPATIPFAEIRLTWMQPIGENFVKPLLPWPRFTSSFSIDGAAVPRGWGYTVCYWIENGIHHVEIPRSSRSVRNVAFLGEHDELVIVVPAQERLFCWEPSQDGPTAVLDATVIWRETHDR
jgi:hypothetical protein